MLVQKNAFVEGHSGKSKHCPVQFSSNESSPGKTGLPSATGIALRAERESDFERSLHWLTAAPVLPDSGVLSWVNPQHPGFRYTEAAALLLRLLTFYAAEQVALCNQLAHALVNDVSHVGGVGKAGREYAFDVAMALAALATHRQRGGQGVDGEVLARLFGFIRQCVENQCGLATADNQSTGHWSLSYGPHLLKLIVALRAYQAAGGPATCTPVMERLLGDQLPLWVGDRFRINKESCLSYLHAHCYALEGLLAFDANGMREVLESGATWLCRVQTAEGGLRAWRKERARTKLNAVEETLQAARALARSGLAVDAEGRQVEATGAGQPYWFRNPPFAYGQFQYDVYLAAFARLSEQFGVDAEARLLGGLLCTSIAGMTELGSVLRGRSLAELETIFANRQRALQR